MADTKITGLTANTAPLITDILPMVDDPGGTPATQKITIANLIPSYGAAKGDVATSQTTTSTSYTGLSTAQTLSVTVGPNGLLLVGVGCDMTNNTGDAFCWMSFALSGGNTLASADVNAVMHQTQGAGHQQAASRVTLLTGLAAGATTVTAQFKVQTGGGGAGTGTFVNRTMWAIPL